MYPEDWEYRLPSEGAMIPAADDGVILIQFECFPCCSGAVDTRFWHCRFKINKQYTFGMTCEERM